MDKALSKAGVKDGRHQAILLDNLPCGIETAKEVLADKTPWETNAPRALLVCHWKGMATGFALLEKTNGGSGER